jgi:hypothetical protein
MRKSERQPKGTTSEDNHLPRDSESAGKGLLAEISDTGFVGLWKDREDIGDSREFARRLRERMQAPVDTSPDSTDK